MKMMRDGRYGGDKRNRSPPPIPWARSRHYDEGEERRSHYASSSNSIPHESEWLNRILIRKSSRGSVKRRDCYWHLDGDRDEMRALSEFDPSLSREESTSMKFQRNHLLDEPANSNTKFSLNFEYDSDYGLGATSVGSCYQGGGVSDIGRSWMLGEKPVYGEIERNETPMMYASHRRCTDIPKRYSHGDGSFLFPSKYMNAGLDNDEDLQFRDHLHKDKQPAADKLSVRDVSEGEDDHKFPMRDTYRYVIPSPQSKGFASGTSGFPMEDSPDCYNDGSYTHSDGFSRSSGMRIESVTHLGYGQESHYKYPSETEDPLNGIIYHQHPQLSPLDRKDEHYMYPDVRRGEKDDIAAFSDEYCGRMVSLREDHARHDSSRTSMADPIDKRITITESSYEPYISENRLNSEWDHYYASEECPSPNYLDAHGKSHLKEQNREVLGYRSAHLDYERKAYRDHESPPLIEDYCPVKGAGRLFFEGRLVKVPMTGYDPSLDEVDGSSPRKMLKGNHGVDEKMSQKGSIKKRLSYGKTANKVQDYGDAGDRRVPLSLLKKPRSSHTRKAGWTSAMVANRKISSFSNRLSLHGVNLPKHSSKPSQFGGRDRKKRLRPGPPPFHISNDLVKRHKPYKNLRRTLDGPHENPHGQEGDSTEVMVTAARIEPPENSEDFNQLVHSAFLKFIKQLNGNPAHRRRFVEQGKNGNLKCSICGSNSGEFVDTESLVNHAYTSSKVGLRTQHLGFHRALCVLMGWKSAVGPNNPWVRQVLPDDEALAVREDLIIWPPVVVIHNSSIGNDNPDARVTVSVKVLEALLGEMGFKGKSKVCRGKAANQSVMVVKFNSTFSGLQEAEKLHKVYMEKKHGRAEFHQINSNSSINNVETQKVENVLYGYLGTADDLEKLDLETRKRCLVKSKKEIWEIAEAPLRTE